ncbi:MAG: adenosylmethionine decarboxylase [Candidatus Omnitrophica bacterium 4484_49]|nr:adenosylmethionine decarboxylase [Candidatus Omnitrophota bacterium]OQX82695.1 MAG: adenosylmethionine decarboxylase [Candidatus Omnitrophica bacterium 4484_49]
MKKTMEKKSVYCKGEVFNYAGTHLLIEMWGAKNIDSAETVKEILKEAVSACGATLLYIHTHTFSPYNGVSGVAVISESHISVHTWPEFGYAAVDIFVCGNVDPYKAVPVIKEGFQAEDIQVMELKRGVLDARKMVF